MTYCSNAFWWNYDGIGTSTIRAKTASTQADVSNPHPNPHVTQPQIDEPMLTSPFNQKPPPTKAAMKIC